jgi:hypothetical protein
MLSILCIVEDPAILLLRLDDDRNWDTDHSQDKSATSIRDLKNRHRK